MASNLMKSQRIPVEYEEVDFLYPIDSSSYVMSGVPASACKSAYIKARAVSGTSKYYGIFGAQWSLDGFVLTWNGGNLGLQLYSDNAVLDIPDTYQFIDGEIHEVNIPASGGSGSNTNYNVQIFNFSQLGRTIEIYELIFYGDNSQEVAHFIPCYRKADNKCGFYDIINNIFREGTGSFIYE